MPTDPATSPAQESSKLRAGLVTLLFTDIVGSTALKQQLGDQPGAALFRRHHQLLRELLARFPGGHEIETAGDSFLMTFVTPSDAVRFSLLLQSRFRQLRLDTSIALFDRIGIHVGEVLLETAQASAKPRELYGVQIDLCSRVMSLAKGGQILMSRGAFDNARQALKGEDIEGIGSLEWHNHGPYLLKGLDEAVEICEAREAGQDLGGPPTSSEKAQRKVSPDEESVLGWRPAIGLVAPNTRWVLQKKLGEGGFGEVWLGQHQHTRERRVFKFCFQAERVRSLKREMTLFRLIKQRVGDHPNIVRLHDIVLDQPPYYVEMDYVDGADLRNWCESQGGISAVPLQTRLELIAQAADGLQAAHEAGIIHRDIKPGNILVSNPKSESRASKFEVKLTDFGIGQVLSPERLGAITRAGFTQTIAGELSSSGSGTQLYMAPEVLAGKPASTRSDIYSLGVVLFQLVSGDFSHPVTTDWQQAISDPLLRDDLKNCFAGNPNDRFAAAGQLAVNLRALPERRAAREQQQAQLAAREKAAYHRGVVRTAALAAAIIVLVSVLALLAFTQSRKAEAGELEARLRLYAANMNLAYQAWNHGGLRRAQELLSAHLPQPGKEDLRGFEWHYLSNLCRDQSQFTFTNVQFVGAHLSEGGRHGLALAAEDHTVVAASENSLKWLDFQKRRESRSMPVATQPITGLLPVANQPGDTLYLAGQIGSLSSTGAALFGSASFQNLRTRLNPTLDDGSFAVSADGSLFAASVSGKTISIFDSNSGSQIGPDFRLQGQETVWALAFSPDARYLACGIGSKIHLLESPALKLLRVLPEHTAFVSTLAFDRTGTKLVSGACDSQIRVWSVPDCVPLFTLNGHQGMVRDVAFSPNGLTVASGGADHTVRLWNLGAGGQPTILHGHAGAVRSVLFSKDGTELYTGSDDKTVKLWDLSSRESTNILRHPEYVHDVAFSPDGKLLAVADYHRRAAVVWSLPLLQRIPSLEKGSDQCLSVRFSPDGALLGTIGVDQIVRLWDVSDWTLKFQFPKQDGWCSKSLSFHPSKPIIAVGWHDLRFWDFHTGSPVNLLVNAPTNGVLGSAFSPDGKWLAVGYEQGQVTIWNTISGQLVHSFHNHSAGANALCFSGDGSLFASGSYDNRIFLFDMKRKVTSRLPDHLDQVTGLAFAPGDKTLVSTSWDGSIRCWSVAAAQIALTLSHDGEPITSLTFSKDGAFMATSGADGTARLWPAPNRDPMMAKHSEPLK